MNGVCHGMHGIGPAKIRPAVTAGAGHANTKSATAQSLVRDALESANVDCDELALAARPRRSLKDVAYASQVSFTFFADIRKSDNRLSKPQAHFTRSPQRPQQRHQTAAIVGNSGHEQRLFLPPQLEARFTGENGIKVCTDHEGTAAEVFEGRYDISDLVS